jgi:hypothetical protein
MRRSTHTPAFIRPICTAMIIFWGPGRRANLAPRPAVPTSGRGVIGLRLSLP